MTQIGEMEMDIVDKLLNQSYLENGWSRNPKTKQVEQYIALIGKSGRSKEDLMDNIIKVAMYAKDNKRKYTLVEAKEVYIKIREMLQ